MRNRKWRRRIGVAVTVYLVFWVLTWVFGPAAVKHGFVQPWAAKRDAQGNPAFAEITQDAEFAGTGFDFWPDPIPDKYPWACVGRPSVPAPFLVYTDYAYLKGGLDGGAGRAYCLWTPWKVYWLWSDSYWAA